MSINWTSQESSKSISHAIEVECQIKKAQKTEEGFSGDTYILYLKRRQKGDLERIIVKAAVDLSRERKVYGKIVPYLSPGSPRLLGVFTYNSRDWLVFEYVKFLPVDFSHKKRITRGLEWIHEKDQKSVAHLAEWEDFLFTPKPTLTDSYFEIIENFSKRKDCYVLGQKLFDHIQKKESLWAELDEEIFEKKETVMHNDVQMNNIRFLVNDSISIIDWTHPSVGASVSDIVQWHGALPISIQSYTRKEIMRIFDIDTSSEQFLRADLRNRLHVLKWMLQCFVVKKESVLEMEKFKQYVESVVKA